MFVSFSGLKRGNSILSGVWMIDPKCSCLFASYKQHSAAGCFLSWTGSLMKIRRRWSLLPQLISNFASIPIYGDLQFIVGGCQKMLQFVHEDFLLMLCVRCEGFVVCSEFEVDGLWTVAKLYQLWFHTSKFTSMVRGQLCAVKYSVGVFFYWFPYTPQCLPCPLGVWSGHYKNTVNIYDAEINICCLFTMEMVLSKFWLYVCSLVAGSQCHALL